MRSGSGVVALGVVAVVVAVVAGCATGIRERPTASTSTTRATATTASTCGVGGIESRTDVPYRDPAELPGVDPNLVSLDVTYPVRSDDCEPGPIVVFVHGGGFVTGDKANTSSDKAELFNREGWVFATINYRLAPGPSTPGAQHPTQVADVAAAVAWLRANATDLHADPDRIALVGHSAGAFLVALVGTDPSLLDGAGAPFDALRCVVSLDTEGFDIATEIASGGRREAMFRNAFGDDPTVWDAASPLRFVASAPPDASFPAFLMVTRGSARRSDRNAEFAAALDAVGATAEVLDAEPLDHAGVNRAVGATGDTIVTPPLMTFLNSCLAA